MHVSTQSTQDSVGLDFDQYMHMVSNYHPLSKNADLLQDQADAFMLGAKGGFDPKISSTYGQKLFKEDPYYRVWEVDLNVPTKLGVEVNAGYDRTSGINLNPQSLDPEGGLFYAGISVPLGRGLLIDSRRAQLKRAEIFQRSNELERILLKNDLMYDAGKAYWEWRKFYEITSSYRVVISFAEEQLRTVKELVVQGDRPSIDTIEATIQVQQLNLLYNQAKLEYANAALYVSSFLWDEEGVAMLLADGAFPSELLIAESPALLMMSDLKKSALNHPKIRLYDLMTEQLEIDERLSKENMKPEAEVKFNFIADGGKNPINAVAVDNHTFGLKFGVPLFFRKERAKLQDIFIKKDQTMLKQESVRMNIDAKINQAINEWQTSYEQFLISSAAQGNYKILLDGETTLFQLGESSLFVINSRQQSYLKIIIKNAELLYKIKIAELKALYSAGVLWQT